MIGIIGSSNVDIVYEVPRFTKPGETQRAKTLNYYFGGKGANQAMTCARLSKKGTFFCSLVGNDSSGEDYLKRFEKAKISGVRKAESKTGSAFIEVSEEGENRIVIYGGANDLLGHSEIDNFLEKYGSSFSLALLQNEIPMKTVEYAINSLKAAGKTIIYDPAPKENTSLDILDSVNFLTPNETEFAYLYDKIFGSDERTTRDKALRFRSELNVNHLIVKNGKRPVLLIDNHNNVEEIDPPKVRALDSTAAGDVFNGAFAVGLARNMSKRDALEFAVKAASLSVTRRGAQPSIPLIEEIE